MTYRDEVTGVGSASLIIGWEADERCSLEVRNDPRPRRTAASFAGISGAVLVIALCAPPLAGRFGVYGHLWELYLLAVVAGVAMLASAVAWLVLPRSAPSARATIAVRDGVLMLQCAGRGRRVMPLSDIEAGWIEDPHTVVLETREGAVYALELPEERNRAALVAALRISVLERVLVVPLASSAAQLPFGRTVSAALPLLGGLLPWAAVVWIWVRIEPLLEHGALRRGHAGLLFALLVATALWLTLTIGPRLVRFVSARGAVIGTEGIVIDEHARRTRLAYVDMVRVESHERGVLVLTRDGKRHLLATVAWNEEPLMDQLPGWAQPTEPWRRREAVLRRIREALALDRARVASVKGDLLDRGARSLSAWREALAKLAGRPADYRGTEITRDDLAAIAIDGKVAPVRRVAAAYALAGEDDDARQRVRIAAGACADEHLRAALEAACEGDLAEGRLRRLPGARS